MEFLDTGPNEAPITELYALISIDEKGNEGICSHHLPNLGITTPLVTSKKRVAMQLNELAQKIANLSGSKVQMVRFTRADNLWEAK